MTKEHKIFSLTLIFDETWSWRHDSDRQSVHLRYLRLEIYILSTNAETGGLEQSMVALTTGCSCGYMSIMLLFLRLANAEEGDYNRSLLYFVSETNSVNLFLSFTDLIYRS